MSKIRFGTELSKSHLCGRMYLPVICYIRRNEGYCALTEATTNVSQFLDLTIPVDPLANKRSIAGVDIPIAGAFVSIQLHEKTIPRGDTLPYVGDKAKHYTKVNIQAR